MHLKKYIPNTITLFNLICGSAAIILVIEGQTVPAAAMIGMAAVFDFFDGFLARLLNVKSEIGKELDSLADVISFGLAPAVFLFSLIRENIHAAGFSGFAEIFPYTALLIAAFSALRLAIFNLDTRQTESFLGLPTPANALFIVSLSLISGKDAIQDAGIITLIADSLWFQLILIPVSCALLVTEIPLFALKFNKGYSFSANRLKYMLAIFTLITLFTLNWAALPLIVIFYILLSLISGKEKF
ncbi:MAG: CDP-diacylglycerol--serine O-phosphatidyltransferase [Bacteroidota bacterium]